MSDTKPKAKAKPKSKKVETKIGPFNGSKDVVGPDGKTHFLPGGCVIEFTEVTEWQGKITPAK